MKEQTRNFAILFGLAGKTGVGAAQEQDRSHRLGQIYLKVFSLGSAWSGNQSSILLKTTATESEIYAIVSPLLDDDDLMLILEISVESALCIGWNADEEGLDALYEVKKIAASPRVIPRAR